MSILYTVHSAICRAFDGYADPQDYVMEAANLARSLGSSATYDDDQWFMAGYDSPFRPIHRRNEVWYIATTA